MTNNTDSSKGGKDGASSRKHSDSSQSETSSPVTFVECRAKHLWTEPIPRWGDKCACGKKKLELFKKRAPELDDKFTMMGNVKSYRTIFKEVDA